MRAVIFMTDPIFGKLDFQKIGEKFFG